MSPLPYWIENGKERFLRVDEEEGLKSGTEVHVEEAQSVEASHKSALPLQDDVQ